MRVARRGRHYRHTARLARVICLPRFVIDPPTENPLGVNFAVGFAKLGTRVFWLVGGDVHTLRRLSSWQPQEPMHREFIQLQFDKLKLDEITVSIARSSSLSPAPRAASRS